MIKQGSFIRLFMLIVMASMLWSCEDEFKGRTEINREYEFFPLSLGKTWEYAYDSTVYLSGGTNVVKNSGLMLWSISDTTETGQFELLKSVKSKASDAYVPNRLERVYIDDNRLIMTDQNVRFINLVFPPLLNTRWDGNIFFNDQIITFIGGDPFMIYDGWDYEITTRDTTMTINGVVYNNVLKVSQTDTENAIERRLSEEYYAKNVGLIYKKLMILDSQKISSNLPWEQKAESGLIFTLSLIK